MSEISDLEQVLLIAAAESDSRSYENQNQIDEDQDESKESENQKIEYQVNYNEETNRKRKREREDLHNSKAAKSNYASIIASHYNQLEEKGLDERSKSRIFHLRNFHNWIKSMLINEYLTKIKDGKKHNAPIRVHDMCCGKGGDLLKWKKGGITHLICSDIASVSLEQCKARYNDMKNRASRERGGANIYSIEYITGDCSRIRLREKFSDPSLKVDLVSCQFSFHYSFENLPRAECMLRNAAECLLPGGYFIGTIPDAYDLIARARRCGNNTYGNSVYQITLDFDWQKPPLFGAKYNFSLEGVVNCPEFLVHFPTLIKVAKKFGLKLIKKEKFLEFFERMKDEGRQLLYNMKSLEAYPPFDSTAPVGTDNDDYSHADDFVKNTGRNDGQIGTLSKSEWEASCKFYFNTVRVLAILPLLIRGFKNRISLLVCN